MYNLSNILFALLSIIISFMSFILVLRTWLQFCQVDTNLPISQTLLRITSPLVNPISKFIPTVKNINFAALLIAAGLVTLQFILLNWSIPSAVLVGLLSLLKTFGQILFFTTLIRALMSWVSQGNHPLDYTVVQITEPVLSIIRRLLPKTGMLDFSVMILVFILYLLNNLLINLFGAFWMVA